MAGRGAPWSETTSPRHSAIFPRLPGRLAGGRAPGRPARSGLPSGGDLRRIIRQGPGAYNVSVDMYVESNYFHIATGEPVWRMVTKTEDVEHSDVAKAVAGEVVAEMRRAGLVN